MKRVFILLLLFNLLITGLTFASVRTVIDTTSNYKIEYPAVCFGDNTIENKINADIYQYVIAFKNDYSKGKFYDGMVMYKLKFEDEKYLSIILIDMRSNDRITKPHFKYIGLNYDKKTGNRIPLRYFVHIASNDDPTLRLCPLYNENDVEVHRGANGSLVTDNYFLNGEGKISLIYQLYKRGSYADGMTYAVLDLKTIDYLNRKNP